MSQHPKIPHLFALAGNGGKPLAVIRAMSTAEARNYALEELLSVEKLTPERAFNLAREYQGPIRNAKPQYANEDDAPAQGGLDLPDDLTRESFAHVGTPQGFGSSDDDGADVPDTGEC